MKHDDKLTKVRSIKNQIRNLQMGTIILLIIVGCISAAFIFSINLRKQKIEVLEHVTDIFYDMLISTNEDKLSQTTNIITQAIDEHGIANARSVLSNVFIDFKLYPYIVFDGQGKVLDESQDFPGETHIMYDHRSDNDHAWIEGDNEEGLVLYVSKYIASKDYYVVCSFLPDENAAVEWVTENFGVDASIFINRTRIASNILINGQTIVGTDINTDLGDELLSAPTKHLGIESVLEKFYISAYMSFGNEGELPVAIIFTGESLQTFYDSIQKMILTITLLGLTLIVISSLISSKLIRKNIVDPLSSVTRWLSHYGNDQTDQQYNPPVHFSELDNLFGTMSQLLDRLNKAKREVESIAYYDELTGLPNRYLLFKQHGGTKLNNYGLLIYIDADDLKTVNDILGHRIGDQLIIEIGKFLYANVKHHDFEVHRLGGDEFVLWHRGDISDEKLIKILEVLKSVGSKQIAIDHYGVSTSLSIGIARDTGTVKSLDDLLRYAEIAMYEVKKTTKNDYVFYTEAMSIEMIQRQRMTEDIRTSIEKNQLSLRYQPKYNLNTNRCDGFEALLRWEHPDRGMVSPGEFIPIAEETGAIIDIGNWVLEESCRMIKRFNTGRQERFKISINVSPVQILKEDFVQNVIQTMIKIGVEPKMLELEITETVLIESLSSAVEKLRQLLILGVGISIDDFGKGYSSLAYLKHLPISTLKIDKMFIDEIDESNNSIVSDIVDLGHHMGLSIVAEGIETKVQLEYLKSIACDAIQGYYYAKPLEEEDLLSFIEKNIDI